MAKLVAPLAVFAVVVAMVSGSNLRAERPSVFAVCQQAIVFTSKDSDVVKGLQRKRETAALAGCRDGGPRRARASGQQVDVSMRARTQERMQWWSYGPADIRRDGRTDGRTDGPAAHRQAARASRQ